MQNSLERLFDGMVVTLRERVAPGVEDPYVVAQVMAMAELLANLATRTEWRCADQRAVVDRVTPLLVEAVTLDAEDADLSAARELVQDPAVGSARTTQRPLDNAALVELRDRSLRSLAGVQAWLGRSPQDELEGLRRRVDALVVDSVDEEMARVRTGMYRRRPEGSG